ncbi:unnamed protein product [Hermetia illucens]|uniref:Uncharacterized protein n=1 Tax=Hermetia illucens TaxID=343691 RepID=A0A7R8USY5_HERIL|nr:unnamed protein product [Hermetia illucens]
MDPCARNTSRPRVVLPEQSPKATASNTVVSTSKRTYREALKNTIRRYLGCITTVKRQKLSHSGTNLFKEIRRKVSLPYASNRPLLQNDDSESSSDDDDYVAQKTTGMDTDDYTGSEALRSHASSQLASGNETDFSEDSSSQGDVTQSTILIDSEDEEVYDLHKQKISMRGTNMEHCSGFSSDEESPDNCSEDEPGDSEGGCVSDKGRDEFKEEEFEASSEDEEEYLRLFEETEDKMLTKMLLEHPDGSS